MLVSKSVKLLYRLKVNKHLVLRNFSSNPKICVVGGGPAAFYAAQYILKHSESSVDIIEKLPIPFGLVR